MKKCILCILSVLIFFSCTEYTPRPKGYSRATRNEVRMIDFRDKHFSFPYASDSQIEYLKSEIASEVWFNISYPQNRAIIYCSYVPLNKENLSELLEDSYKLAYSHASKAESIAESSFTDSLQHRYGMVYDIKGSVVSPVQFYITDKTSNFLRGSLYFSDVVQSDSIAPVVEFIRKDIVHLMESIQWVNNK